MKKLLGLAALIIGLGFLAKTNPSVETFQKNYYEEHTEEVDSLEDVAANIATLFESLHVERHDYVFCSVFGIEGTGYRAIGFAGHYFLELPSGAADGEEEIWKLMELIPESEA